MEAAIGVVALVFGPLQFLGLDDVQRHLPLPRKFTSLLKVAAGQAG